MQRGIFAALGLLGMMLTACGGTSKPGAPASASPSIETGATGQPSDAPAVRWKAVLREGEGYTLVAARPGLVIATTGRGGPDGRPLPDGLVVALDPESGKERWRTTLDCAPFVPVIAGEAVVVPCSDGTILRLGASDGAVAWRTRTGGAPVAPVVLSDRVVSDNSDSELYTFRGVGHGREPSQEVVGLDLASGAVAWRVPTGRDHTGVAAADGVVVAATYSGRDAIERRVLGIEARSGRVLWTASTSIALLPITADGDLVFLPEGSGALEVRRVANGTVAWTQGVPEGGMFVRPIGIASVVIAATNTHAMYAFDRKTGAIAWRRDFCDCNFLAARLGDRLVLSVGGLGFLDAKDGSFIAGFELDSTWGVGLPAVAGEWVVVGSTGEAIVYGVR